MILLFVALPGFLIISSVSGIVNVLFFVLPATACLLILGFCGSHYNRSMDSVKSRLHNVKSQYYYAYWKILTPELLDLRLFSSSVEVSEYLDCQLHIKGTVLYF
jgi:hypothetical protein